MSTVRNSPNKGFYYSNLTSPIRVDMQFTVASADTGGFGLTGLKSNGYVQNVFMHTSATPATGSPNPAAGYAQIVLNNNFASYIGLDFSAQSPTTGSNININATGLTIHNPYQITNLGAVPQPKFTVTTVADTNGSLTSTYLTLSDQLGNNYVLWFQVGGVGTPPLLTGALNGFTAVPVSIAKNAANTAVATALETVIVGLNNSLSFTGSVASNVATITGAVTPIVAFSRSPAAGTTGFTVSSVTFTSLMADWAIVGVPAGLSPAVGQTFYAIATGDGGINSTGTVAAIGSSGIGDVEVMGISNLSISNSNIAANGGAIVNLQFLAPTSSAVTTPIATNPANGTVVSLSLLFDQSSVSVSGSF